MIILVSICGLVEIGYKAENIIKLSIIIKGLSKQVPIDISDNISYMHSYFL